jgi:hypothetical protein
MELRGIKHSARGVTALQRELGILSETPHGLTCQAPPMIKRRLLLNGNGRLVLTLDPL